MLTLSLIYLQLTTAPQPQGMITPSSKAQCVQACPVGNSGQPEEPIQSISH
jgi:hypothetical protein